MTVYKSLETLLNNLSSRDPFWPTDFSSQVAAQINDSSSPYFETDFNKTEMMIVGTFDKLSAKLHIDSFLNLYEFGKLSNLLTSY